MVAYIGIIVKKKKKKFINVLQPKAGLVHSNTQVNRVQCIHKIIKMIVKLECGPMPNAMAALPNIGSALCSTPQSLADAHY